jgi:hypothetical protein
MNAIIRKWPKKEIMRLDISSRKMIGSVPRDTPIDGYFLQTDDGSIVAIVNKNGKSILIIDNEIIDIEQEAVDVECYLGWPSFITKISARGFQIKLKEFCPIDCIVFAIDPSVDLFDLSMRFFGAHLMERVRRQSN